MNERDVNARRQTEMAPFFELAAPPALTPALSAWRRCSTLTDVPAFAAIDLGAESGRVVLGRLASGRVELEGTHRFPNRPVRLPDGLRRNVLSLFADAVEGLARASTGASLRGVGVDSWVASASAQPVGYEPHEDREAAETIYGHFLTVTGLGAAESPSRPVLEEKQ